MMIVMTTTKLRSAPKALCRITTMRAKKKRIAQVCVLACDFLPEVPLLPVTMSLGYVIDVSPDGRVEMEKDHLR